MRAHADTTCGFDDSAPGPAPIPSCATAPISPSRNRAVCPASSPDRPGPACRCRRTSPATQRSAKSAASTSLQSCPPAAAPSMCRHLARRTAYVVSTMSARTWSLYDSKYP